MGAMREEDERRQKLDGKNKELFGIPPKQEEAAA